MEWKGVAMWCESGLSILESWKITVGISVAYCATYIDMYAKEDQPA